MSETSEPQSLSNNYFDDVYQADQDPWNFQTSEYEQEKYQATLAALPRRRYRKAFEIGCSIGVLTKQLARRTDKLLAVDVADAALWQARTRLANASHLTIKKMRVPDEFPDEKFDLILVSEVGYYWSREDLRKAQNLILNHLTKDGHLLLVHWTPFVADYPQTGDEVHNSFIAFAHGEQPDEMKKMNETKKTNDKIHGKSLLKHLSGSRHEKYRIDLFARA